MAFLTAESGERLKTLANQQSTARFTSLPENHKCIHHRPRLKVNLVVILALNPSLECDTENGWTQHKWGSEQACFRRIGRRHRPEGAASCREVGASLPLPKTAEENEDLKNINSALAYNALTMIDAFDVNGDGIWEDSYGNVVTFFGELDYDEHEYAGYQYITTGNSRNDYKWKVVPDVYENLSSTNIVCQIPLAPPKPTTPPCVAPASFDELFESLNSVVDEFDNEVSNWNSEPKWAVKYQKRGSRAQKWLRNTMKTTKRYILACFP